MLDLGHLPILVTATIIPVNREDIGAAFPASPEDSYQLPENVIDPIQFVWDDRMLPFADDKELAQYSVNWRSLHGAPQVVYRGDVGSRRFRLVPLPDRPSEAPIFLFGYPMDDTYPQNCVVVFHTDNRQNTPPYLDLPLAFFVLGREFSRDSNHRDLAFAAHCARMAQSLLEMAR